jgi:two-component system, NarL family, response regulator DevR
MDATTTRGTIKQPRRKLFLFCSHPVAQEEFTRLLKRTDFDIVLCPELLLPEAEADAFDAKQPYLAVIDASDVIATLEFVRMLRLEQRAVYLLVLLAKLEDSVTSPLLRLGVKGLLTYRQAPRELAGAARQVSTGMYWVPREILTRFVESVLPELGGGKSLDSQPGISRREREVLDLLLDNLANKEIASKLFVCERTVKFHVSNLLSKFGVRRRADLIVLWMRRTSAYPWLARDVSKTTSARVH